MTPDTVCWIASMTKPVTAVAAMQLVERGVLALDQEVGGVLSELASPLVLEGFAPDGAAKLRPARHPITLRHLLTHTAGFSYDIWNGELKRYLQQAGPGQGRHTVLVCDPGDRWEYGIGTDWLGWVVEAASGLSLEAYFRTHIFAPLGMDDTSFLVGDAQHSRLAARYLRREDGTLEPVAFRLPRDLKVFWGGGGLYSTARDYLIFLRMLLDGGQFGGVRLLRPETVALMGQNQIGSLPAGRMRSFIAESSNDVDFFPGMEQRWGLGFLINTERAPAGRSAGSLAWGGLCNTYFWIDPSRQVSGLMMTQILPFADGPVLRLFRTFERAVYDVLGGA
jgi:methyl acetate hydrolase